MAEQNGFNLGPSLGIGRGTIDETTWLTPVEEEPEERKVESIQEKQVEAENQMISEIQQQEQKTAGLEYRPEITVGRLLRAPIEGTKDFIRGTTGGAGVLMDAAPYTPEQASKLLKMTDRQLFMRARNAGRKVPEFRKMLQSIVDTGDVPDNERLFVERLWRDSGEKLQDMALADWLQTHPEYYSSSGFWEDLFRAAPQVAGQIVIGTLTGGLGVGASMYAFITGSTYEKLRKQNVPHDRALKAAAANALWQAPLESIGISKVTKLFNVKSLLGKRLKHIIAAGIREGGTEFLQQLPEEISEIWAKDPNTKVLRTLWNKISTYEGLASWVPKGIRSGLIGAILGGGAGAIATVGTKFDDALTADTTTEGTTDEVLDKTEKAEGTLKQKEEEQRKPEAAKETFGYQQPTEKVTQDVYDMIKARGGDVSGLEVVTRDTTAEARQIADQRIQALEEAGYDPNEARRLAATQTPATTPRPQAQVEAIREKEGTDAGEVIYDQPPAQEPVRTTPEERQAEIERQTEALIEEEVIPKPKTQPVVTDVKPAPEKVPSPTINAEVSPTEKAVDLAGLDEDTYLEDMQKLAALKQANDLPESNPEQAAKDWAGVKQTDINQPAIMLPDGSVYTGPKVEGKHFSKVKTSDAKAIKKSFDKARGKAMNDGKNPANAVTGYMINGNWYSMDYVAIQKGLYGKAAKSRRRKFEAAAEETQKSIADVRKDVRQEMQEEMGKNKQIENTFNKLTSKPMVKRIIRIARRKFGSLAEPFAQEKGLYPDELTEPLLINSWGYVMNKVRKGESIQNNEYITAMVNQLGNFIKTEGGKAEPSAIPIDQVSPETTEAPVSDQDIKLNPKYESLINRIRSEILKLKRNNKKAAHALKGKGGSRTSDIDLLLIAQKWLDPEVVEEILDDIDPITLPGPVVSISPEERLRQIALEAARNRQLPMKEYSETVSILNENRAFRNAVFERQDLYESLGMTPQNAYDAALLDTRNEADQTKWGREPIEGTRRGVLAKQIQRHLMRPGDRPWISRDEAIETARILEQDAIKAGLDNTYRVIPNPDGDGFIIESTQRIRRFGRKEKDRQRVDDLTTQDANERTETEKKAIFLAKLKDEENVMPPMRDVPAVVKEMAWMMDWTDNLEDVASSYLREESPLTSEDRKKLGKKIRQTLERERKEAEEEEGKVWQQTMRAWKARVEGKKKPGETPEQVLKRRKAETKERKRRKKERIKSVAERLSKVGEEVEQQRSKEEARKALRKIDETKLDEGDHIFVFKGGYEFAGKVPEEIYAKLSKIRQQMVREGKFTQYTVRDGERVKLKKDVQKRGTGFKYSPKTKPATPKERIQRSAIAKARSKNVEFSYSNEVVPEEAAPSIKTVEAAVPTTTPSGRKQTSPKRVEPEVERKINEIFTKAPTITTKAVDTAAKVIGEQGSLSEPVAKADILVTKVDPKSPVEPPKAGVPDINGEWDGIPVKRFLKPGLTADQYLDLRMAVDKGEVKLTKQQDGQLNEMLNEAEELEEAEFEEEFDNYENEVKNVDSAFSYFEKIMKDQRGSVGPDINNTESADVQHASSGLLRVFKMLGNRQSNRWERIKKKFDVQSNFNPIGAKETGFHVKNVYSMREHLQEKFRRDVLDPFNDLVKKHIPNATSRHLANAVLAAEDVKYAATLRRAAGETAYKKHWEPIIEYLRDFFVKAQKEYSDRGVEVDFVANKMKRIEAKWMETTNWEKAKKYMKQMAQLQAVRYIHIPISFWANEKINAKLETTRHKKKTEALRNLIKKRRVNKIGDLIRAGLIKLDEVNPYEILAHYGVEKATNFSMYNIRDAMVKDGVLKKQRSKPKPDGNLKIGVDPNASLVQWEELNKDKYSALLGLKGEGKVWIRSDAYIALQDALAYDESTGGLATLLFPEGNFQKAMSAYKMLRFYNPIFLPIYDVVQSVGLAGAVGRHAPSSIIRSVNSVLKRDRHYDMAAENGLFSKPFSWGLLTELQYAKTLKKYGKVNWAKSSTIMAHDEIMLALKRLGELRPFAGGFHLGAALVKPVMQASWDTAWWLDSGVRLYTYHYLRNKGFSGRDAAQAAAVAHGDYAGVPAATRRQLNKFFFTPTFKVAMLKAHKHMVEGTIKYGLGKDKSLHSRQMMKAGIMWLAWNYGTRLMLEHWGFEPEEWSRRYKKDVMTRRGPRELIITWSHPLNLMPKYGMRFWRLMFPHPAEKNALLSFAKTFSYEIHPMFQTLIAGLSNRRPDGSNIYSPNDDRATRWKKLARWGIGEMVPLINFVAEKANKPQTPGRAEAQKYLRDSIGDFGELMTSLFMFSYTRATPERRLNYNLRSLSGNLKYGIRDEILKGNKINEKWVETYIQRQIETMQKYAEERKKE